MRRWLIGVCCLISLAACARTVARESTHAATLLDAVVIRWRQAGPADQWTLYRAATPHQTFLPAAVTPEPTRTPGTTEWSALASGLAFGDWLTLTAWWRGIESVPSNAQQVGAPRAACASLTPTWAPSTSTATATRTLTAPRTATGTPSRTLTRTMTPTRTKRGRVR